MYAWYIFRYLYTFDILFLFFELWSPKGILIVKSSQWGRWACGHTHIYEHTCPAPQRETSTSQAPTWTQHPQRAQVARCCSSSPADQGWSPLVGSMCVCEYTYVCIYIYLYTCIYIYKNTAWIIPVVGPRFPSLPRCWHPDVPDVDVHNLAPVVGTPTSYPTHSHISTEKRRAL